MNYHRQERLLQVLLSPHVSEKATQLADNTRCHTFKVMPDATKDEVRAAVELLFEVEVSGVNIVNMKGKAKGLGRRRGRRQHWKKAYVSLAEGHDIQLGGTE